MKNYDSLYNTMNNNNCYSKSSYNDLVVGNNIDMNLQKNDTDVRADIVVSRVETVRIWGVVKDCDGMPIPNAMIKLVKPINKNGIMEYESIAYTLADCAGFYQMEAPARDCDSKYKILVSKACIGNERIIHGDNCKPCPPASSCPPSPPCSPMPPAQHCPPPQQNQPCPPANHGNQYTSNIDKKPMNYSPEPVHNQFYGELVNKGNIFKKSE